VRCTSADAHDVQIDHEGWLAVSDAIDWVLAMRR
jgi:hypothetical protein